jgi:hypothetical protein
MDGIVNARILPDNAFFAKAMSIPDINRNRQEGQNNFVFHSLLCRAPTDGITSILTI